LHFKNGQCRLQFMKGLSNFGAFANFVLQHALLLVVRRSPVWIRLALA
jgi:hypothetical protein